MAQMKECGSVLKPEAKLNQTNWYYFILIHMRVSRVTKLRQVNLSHHCTIRYYQFIYLNRSTVNQSLSSTSVLPTVHIQGNPTLLPLFLFGYIHIQGNRSHQPSIQSTLTTCSLSLGGALQLLQFSFEVQLNFESF